MGNALFIHCSRYFSSQFFIIKHYTRAAAKVRLKITNVVIDLGLYIHKAQTWRACSIRTRVNVYILNKKILWLGGCKRSKSSLDIIVNILFFNIYRVLVEQWIFHACLVVSVFIHVHESLICYGFKSYAIITTPLNIHKIFWRFEYHKHVQILKCSNLFGFLSIYKYKSSFFFSKNESCIWNFTSGCSISVKTIYYSQK